MVVEGGEIFDRFMNVISAIIYIYVTGLKLWFMIYECLVGGFNHLEKYEFVNGKDDIPYMKWKIKFMFETTAHI